jgi:four helix bundle protein
VNVYKATEAMPKSETYGLTGQIRRAAASVPANIAEGSARKTTKDLLQFLAVASGSLREVDTYVEIIERLELPVETRLIRHGVEEVSRMLGGLFRSLSVRE